MTQSEHHSQRQDGVTTHKSGSTEDDGVDRLTHSVAGLNVNPIPVQNTGTNPYQQYTSPPNPSSYNMSESQSNNNNNSFLPPPSSSTSQPFVDNDPYSGLDSLDRPSQQPQRNSNPFETAGANPFASTTGAIPPTNPDPFAPVDANGPTVDPFWEREDEEFWKDDDDIASGQQQRLPQQQQPPARPLEPMATGVSIHDFWDQEEQRFGPVVIPPTLSMSVPREPTVMEEDNLPTPIAPQPFAPNPLLGTQPLQLPGTEPQQSNLQSQPIPSARSTQANLENVDEKYTIKHINWMDPASTNVPRTTNTRTSPIILQNENGPCPLIAVVNALTLSTPIDTTTPLTSALSTRETISLQLLLDTVFDELTSRNHNGTDLDISEIFAFLTTLHTGMNVNPRFVPTTPTPLGTFDQTREFSLYSKFGIPLVHGWLPHPSSPTYAAFSRSAQTYEDAQTLLFGEDELLSALSAGTHTGPVPIEQKLQDLDTIRHFLDQNPSQLTEYGLESLRDHFKGIGIFFRNDHFATILNHNGMLLSLVTDTGFGSYQEVVWQTLSSVLGEGSEFLSGDYRPVGNTPSGGNPHNSHTERRRSRSLPRPAPTEPTGEPDIDSDFALALSLQQEEDARARRQSPAAPAGSRRSLPTPAPAGANPNSLVNLALPTDQLPTYSSSVGSTPGRPNSTPLAPSASTTGRRRASVVERGREARGMLEELSGARSSGSRQADNFGRWDDRQEVNLTRGELRALRAELGGREQPAASSGSRQADLFARLDDRQEANLTRGQLRELRALKEGRVNEGAAPSSGSRQADNFARWDDAQPANLTRAELRELREGRVGRLGEGGKKKDKKDCVVM